MAKAGPAILETAQIYYFNRIELIYFKLVDANDPPAGISVFV